jgi:hypothetical protein
LDRVLRALNKTVSAMNATANAHNLQDCQKRSCEEKCAGV